MGGETSASEQKGVMQWTGTAYKCRLFRLFTISVRACDVVCPLDTATQSLSHGGLSCFLVLLPRSFVLVRCLREANVAIFRERSSWSRHLFQMVSLVITSMTLPLNHIFVILLANVHVIPKKQQLNTVENTKENLIHVIHKKTKRQ